VPPHRKDQLLGRNPKLLQGVSDEPDLFYALRSGPCSACSDEKVANRER
jgi:hypothetical protein